MHWAGGIAYVVAATIFQFDGRTPMLAFVAAVLMVWLAIAVAVEGRAIAPPSTPGVDGWTPAPSQRAAESLRAIQQLSLVAGVMRLSLSLFGFLLASWALLP